MAVNYRADNTIRARLGYVWGGEKHKLNFRFKEGTTANSINLKLSTALIANASGLNSAVLFESLEIAAKGSNVFNPFDWTPVAGSGANTANNAGTPAAVGVQVLGRSTGGSKVSWTWYGQDWSLNRAMRYVSGGFNTPQQAVYNIIAELVSDSSFCAIDGTSIVQRPYVNIVVNDFLTRKYRQ